VSGSRGGGSRLGDQARRSSRAHGRTRAAGDSRDKAGGRDSGARSHAASEAAAATALASAAPALPEDASPDTVPFTGLELSLLAMLGLAGLVAGGVLRRAALQRVSH
jgi:hypothetical protein